MIVAIDGPAGVGKSTAARCTASKTGFSYINSGQFYRAITFAVMEKGIELNNHTEIIKVAENSALDFKNGIIFLNGRKLDTELHSDKIDLAVAQLSAIIPVRHIVNDSLKKAVTNLDVIVEGRDITTVVFPDADVKVFLDASPRVRALRRFNQGTSSLSMEEIEKSISDRDKIDRNKEVGALKIADDAFYLDTSDLTINEVCEKVVWKIFISGK